MTHLRIVPPPGEAPPARPRATKADALSLSPVESKHLRAAIRNIARTYGGIAPLARALGVCKGALGRNRRPLSPGLAVALWRLTRTPLDVLLRPTLAAVPSAPAPAPGGVA